MALYRYSLDAGPPPEACRGGVLTLGNFDGVHVGHQALLHEARQQAQARGVAAIAVTFDPHPAQLLRPDRVPPFLTTLPERAALLHRHGADEVLLLHTTPALLQWEARPFFDTLLRQQLRPRALVEGNTFTFGRDRAGTTAVLAQWCAEANLPLTLVAPCEQQGQAVSSSRVREALQAGDVAEVRTMLARPYAVQGIVGTGQRRGASLGFPTANLEQVATLLPGDGVYAARVHHGNQSWPAAANLGPNPTFGEQARKLEAHLIGFSGDLYGQPLTLEFLAKIRDTRRFAGVEELVAQVRADIDAARIISEAP